MAGRHAGSGYHDGGHGSRNFPPISPFMQVSQRVGANNQGKTNAGIETLERPQRLVGVAAIEPALDIGDFVLGAAREPSRGRVALLIGAGLRFQRILRRN